MMNEVTKPTFEMDVEVKIPENIPKVEHNLDKLREYAINLNNFYKSLIITEKDIKDAETEKAKLNKLIDQVKRLRIDNVKKYKEPIEDFEKTAKEVESILSEASGTIKYTLDEYDTKRIEEKREKVIKPILNNIISQSFMKGYLINPDNIVEDKRWFNKTFKDADIESDIQAQVDEFIRQEETLNQGIEVIKSNIAMSNDSNLNEGLYIERFKFSKDLTSVLADIARDHQINVSHETSKENINTGIFDSTQTMYETVISFRGNTEQINKIREYAKQIGMEEV